MISYNPFAEQVLDKTGKLHNLTGPALRYENGSESWFKHGVYHRIDGPAVIYVDSPELNQYWIDGVRYTLDDFRFIVFSVYGKKVNDL